MSKDNGVLPTSNSKRTLSSSIPVLALISEICGNGNSLFSHSSKYSVIFFFTSNTLAGMRIKRESLFCVRVSAILIHHTALVENLYPKR